MCLQGGEFTNIFYFNINTIFNGVLGFWNLLKKLSSDSGNIFQNSFSSKPIVAVTPKFSVFPATPASCRCKLLKCWLLVSLTSDDV